MIEASTWSPGRAAAAHQVLRGLEAVHGAAVVEARHLHLGLGTQGAQGLAGRAPGPAQPLPGAAVMRVQADPGLQACAAWSAASAPPLRQPALGRQKSSGAAAPGQRSRALRVAGGQIDLGHQQALQARPPGWSAPAAAGGPPPRARAQSRNCTEARAAPYRAWA
jgi:hypothetical protein